MVNKDYQWPLQVHRRLSAMASSTMQADGWWTNVGGSRTASQSSRDDALDDEDDGSGSGAGGGGRGQRWRGRWRVPVSHGGDNDNSHYYTTLYYYDYYDASGSGSDDEDVGMCVCWCASDCVVDRAPDLQSGSCRFESRPGLLRTKVC